MVYYGTNNKSDQDYSVFESIDDILVMQQHCGGENVIVYKGSRKAGGFHRSTFFYSNDLSRAKMIVF